MAALTAGRTRTIADAPGRRRRAPTARTIARRRTLVWLAKYSLPLVAVLLLGSIAAWPEIARVTDAGRVSFRRAFSVDPESGRMIEPRFKSVDERGRPYTLTAATALQTSADRIALDKPKGDVVTESGTWIMVDAREGVFIQHASQLDLAGEATLYREDGTIIASDTAAVDLKQGAATTADRTHAEGPFGQLDAQRGYTLVDKGAVIQFHGASHLVLNNAANAGPQAPAKPGTPPVPVKLKP